MKRTNGVDAEQLLHASAENKKPEDWSPDGTRVLYTELNQATEDLWMLPLTGDRQPRPIVRSPFKDIDGRFSPDGRWIAYSSNESGDFQVYVLSFPEANRRLQISTAGGWRPGWRADGRELFFVTPDTSVLMAVDLAASSDGGLKAGRPRRLFTVPANSRYSVTRDGRFLVNSSSDPSADAVSLPLKVMVHWQRATP